MGGKSPYEKAAAAAMRTLSRRARSEEELRRKLTALRFEPPVVDEVLVRLRDLGYLNDRAFAEQRASALVRHGRMGPRAALARLTDAGLSADLAAEALRGAISEQGEEGLARQALARRGAAGGTDPKSRARACRFLLGRGFSQEVVAHVLGLSEEMLQ